MIGSGTRVLLIHDPETMALPLASRFDQESFLVVHAHA